MYDQAKYQTYSESKFFKDGTSFRPLVAGTIARGELRADSLRYAGKTADGKWTEELPAPITENTLRRGQERYNIYCSPCHGSTGDGQGMIVRRGLSPPPSFHIDRLRQAPVGHYFDVITNGYGAMYPYGYRVQVDDRWAIIAYIRALQLHEKKYPPMLPRILRVTRCKAEKCPMIQQVLPPRTPTGARPMARPLRLMWGWAATQLRPWTSRACRSWATSIRTTTRCRAKS
jgi:mono/diheme cytochrome c family protein